MLPPLLEALLEPGCYPHPVGRIELVETHISWVLLTGEYAYKIKKPVDLGFLDFSTLAKRRHFCDEELRLNRRLAPQLYLDVVPITESAGTLRIAGGDGEPIEYAVKMRQFAQDAQLDRVLARGELRPEHIDSLARELARFHGEILVARPETPFGEPAVVLAPMRENFEQIRPRVEAGRHGLLAQLERWTARTYEQLAPVLAARKREVFVRECHGDAHLANMALLEGEVVLFDCLEFNANLRWIDIISELAFATMDLDDRGRKDLAWRFVNGYLEHTGDYAGVRLLRFYQVYRALVRAKVAAIRLGQAAIGVTDRTRAEKDLGSYLELAQGYTRTGSSGLLITHGLSGSGKTFLTQGLVESLGAIRIRSDVERKRLQGLSAEARSGSGVATGLYAESVTRETYARLASLARAVLQGGMTAIVDATFLQAAQRKAFAELARSLDIPFLVLATRATEQTLRARIATRAVAGRDASEANLDVLARQLAGLEPIVGDERELVIEFDTESLPLSEEIARAVRARLVAT